MQLLLTDYELVILALRTYTCLQAKIYQCVSFALFYSLLITYFWNVFSKPPWHLKRPQIDFSMHASCKESTPPEIFRAKYYEICDQYQDYCKLYTCLLYTSPSPRD